MRILQDSTLEMVSGGLTVQLDILHSPNDKLVTAPSAANGGALNAFGLVTGNVPPDSSLFDALKVIVTP